MTLTKRGNLPFLAEMGRRQNLRGNIRQSIKRKREVGENAEAFVKKAKVPAEKIKIVLHNARGWDEITEQDAVNLITNQKPEVFGVVETHLREEDGTRKLGIPKGYSVVEARRSDLADDKDGGGIMVIYKNAKGIDIRPKKLRIRKEENMFVEKERLWVTVKTKTTKLAVCFVYVASENRSEKDKEKFNIWNTSIYEVLQEDIKKLRREGFKVVINGDMNGWVGAGPEGIPGNRSEVNSNGKKFMDFLNNAGMVHVNGTEKCTGLYTRHSSNSSTVLDYVSVGKDDLDLVKSMFIDENSVLGGNSDHVYVITTLEEAYVAGIAPTTKSRLATKWKIEEVTDWTRFKETQQELLKEVPQEEWNQVETLGERLSNILVKSMEEGVGESVAGERKRKQYPAEVRREMGKMKEMRSVWRALRSKMTKNPSDKTKKEMIEGMKVAEKQKGKVGKVLAKFWQQSRTRVTEKLSEGGVGTSKLFWSYVVNKPKSGQSFPFLQDLETGEMKSEQKDVKAIVEEFLRNLFKGSFNQEVMRPLEEEDLMVVDEGPEEVAAGEQVTSEEGISKAEQDPPTDKRLEQDFTEEEVNRMIVRLKNCKAMGFDKVPNEAIKNSCPKFVSAIVRLFNNIRKQGSAPKAWKTGRLVLVHKKGPLTDMGNYRPLTVLAAMSGLFSRVLNERLTEVVESKKLLGEVQQGFRRGRRGADNTFVLNTIIMKGTATRKPPHLAYLDIKKVTPVLCLFVFDISNNVQLIT